MLDCIIDPPVRSEDVVNYVKESRPGKNVIRESLRSAKRLVRFGGGLATTSIVDFEAPVFEGAT